MEKNGFHHRPYNFFTSWFVVTSMIFFCILGFAFIYEEQTGQLKQRKEKEKVIHSIECYSGNLLLLEDISIGIVGDVGAYSWTSKIDGQEKRWNGVCVVKLLK
jgi:hypothetical protein